MIRVRDLADKLNITQQRFSQILKELSDFAPIKKINPKRGQIDEVEFFLSYIKWQQKKFDEKMSQENELERETIRLKKAQATKFEIENEREEGRLIPKEDVIKLLEQIFSNIRNKMISLPNKLAHLVFGSKTLTDAKIKIKLAVNDALNELADPKIIFRGTDEQIGKK